MRVLVATRDQVLLADPGDRMLRPAAGVDGRPTCLAADPSSGRLWCGTVDGGETWRSPGEGLEVGYLRSVTIDPGDRMW